MIINGFLKLLSTIKFLKLDMLPVRVCRGCPACDKAYEK